MAVFAQTPDLTAPLSNQVCDKVVGADSNRVRARVLRDALSYPFYYLGELSQIDGPEPRASNYIVAVNLHDMCLGS